MNRRDLLTCVPILALPSVSLARVSGDPHRDWLEEWRRLGDAIESHPTGDDDALDPMHKQRYALDELIASTEAKTIDGLRAQLEWLVEDGMDYWGCDDHELGAQTMLKALKNMA